MLRPNRGFLVVVVVVNCFPRPAEQGRRRSENSRALLVIVVVVVVLCP
jgi:hypothetical protein